MDYPDTFYHIMSRGNERRKIFRDTEDYKKFIKQRRRVYTLDKQSKFVKSVGLTLVFNYLFPNCGALGLGLHMELRFSLI